MSFEIRHVNYRSSESDKREVMKFSSGAYGRMTESRLEEPWGEESYGLAAAFVGERCIGTSAYTVSARGQGIMAQVFTDAEYRGKGIARATIGAAIEGYREHGARAAYLASWKDWVRALYRSFGFEFVGAMGERHAFKLTLEPSGRDEVLFAPDQAACTRPMAVGDQGDLSALFNAGHGGVVKHYELGCFLGSHFEGEFYALREEHTGFEGVVLDGEETVLGFGTIIPSRRRHEAHRGVLDLLVHPNYADRFAELLDRLHRESRMEVVTAFVEDSEEARRQAFERAGYRAVGRLEDCLRIGDEVFSLTSYEKRLDRSAG